MTDMDIQPECELPPTPDPFARFKSDGEWADGVRPPHICETWEDVEWALANSDSAETSIACGYCGKRYRNVSKTPDKAAYWLLHEHECEAEGVPIEQWLAA